MVGIDGFSILLLTWGLGMIPVRVHYIEMLHLHFLLCLFSKKTWKKSPQTLLLMSNVTNGIYFSSKHNPEPIYFIFECQKSKTNAHFVFYFLNVSAVWVNLPTLLKENCNSTFCLIFLYLHKLDQDWIFHCSKLSIPQDTRIFQGLIFRWIGLSQ